MSDPTTGPAGTTTSVDGRMTRTRLRTLERRRGGNAAATGTATVRKRAATCPPGLVDAGVDSLQEITGAVIRGGVDYWSGLVERGATPLDVASGLLAWQREISRRSKPEWASEHRVVAEWPLARLRDFSPQDAPHDVVPTLVLPPQAGHDSCIVDYAAGQSQVQTALDAGCRRVLSMDWIGASTATRNASIEEYVEVIRTAIDSLGGHVNLVGDCQGGWLATIYAALHPETVHTLAIAGAPIDFHAGEPLIHDWMQFTSPTGRLALFKAVVAAGGGVLPGEFLVTGFKIMQPEAEAQRQLALLANIHDKRHVERYRRFEDWFQWTQDIPGAFYLWIIEHLFQENELLKGTLTVGGRTVDLAEIHCPVYLLAGAKDHITPPAQVYALASFVSTPPEDVVRLETGGGHLGLFMGHDALENYWRPVFADMAARSHPEADD